MSIIRSDIEFFPCLNFWRFLLMVDRNDGKMSRDVILRYAENGRSTRAHDALPSAAIAASTMAAKSACGIGSKVTPKRCLNALQNLLYRRSFRSRMGVSMQTPSIDTSHSAQ